jgi:signal transduction histidine kinase
LLWALYRYRLYQIAREFNMRLDERVDERTRIARELHDTLLQSFQGLMLRLQAGVDQLPPGKAKDAIEKALERGDQAIAEGRDSIHDLRSSTIVGNDLAAAVAPIGDEMASADSATFRLVVEGSPRELHPILRDEIYRIAREAVRNAFRHAQAGRIEAEIAYGERLLRLRVRDDGRGMDPGTVEEGRPGHYGLPGMRERATRIGAQLNVWSAIGAGSEVELILPGAIAYGAAPARRGFGLFRKMARRKHERES